MNYGGHYRNTPENLARQARAEDLDVVYNLIVNKEERVPDIGYFRAGPRPGERRRRADHPLRRNITPATGATSACCTCPIIF